MLKIFLILIGLSLISLGFNSSVFSQGTSTEAPQNLSSLSVVLDLERASNMDILLLRNGDQLTGTILNETFNIRTSYSQLHFNNKTIAGIDLEGGTNNIESIITVNNNKFSGFLDDAIFVFKLQTGPTIKIRREKILKAIFRVRESERQGIPQRRFIILKNGDFFSGKIQNGNLIISTTYAELPVTIDDADSIRLIGNDNPLTKVKMLNGDMLQGVLKTEDINISLDVGPNIQIYKDKIDIIYCRKGYVPNIDTTSNKRTAVSSNISADMVLKSTINPANKAKPAYFPHKKHQDFLTCNECHHGKDSSDKKLAYTHGMKIEKCEFCHNKNAGMSKKLFTFKLAAHASCKACHKSKRKELSKCTVCHQKNL